MLKTKTGERTESGEGRYRVVYDEDDNITSIELWAFDPKLRGSIKSYNAYKIDCVGRARTYL